LFPRLSKIVAEVAADHVEGGNYIGPEFQLGQVYDGGLAEGAEAVVLYRPVYVTLPHVLPSGSTTPNSRERMTVGNHSAAGGNAQQGGSSLGKGGGDGGGAGSVTVGGSSSGGRRSTTIPPAGMFTNATSNFTGLLSFVLHISGRKISNLNTVLSDTR
jgi:hypothetical protein